MRVQTKIKWKWKEKQRCLEFLTVASVRGWNECWITSVCLNTMGISEGFRREFAWNCFYSPDCTKFHHVMFPPPKGTGEISRASLLCLRVCLQWLKAIVPRQSIAPLASPRQWSSNGSMVIVETGDLWVISSQDTSVSGKIPMFGRLSRNPSLSVEAWSSIKGRAVCMSLLKYFLHTPNPLFQFPWGS